MRTEYHSHPDADAITEGSLQLVRPDCIEASTVLARAAALVTQSMLPGLIAAQDLYDQAVNETLRDKMTGLDNQRGFSISLQRAAAFALRHNLSYTVACMYVTNLKHINDTLGYKAGDDTLIAAGQCLVAASGMDVPERQAGCELRQAARLENGDEFGVVLVGAEEPETLNWWQAMDTALRNVNVEMCLGISTSPAYAPQSPTDIFDSSYAALQQARLESQGIVIR